MKRIVDKEELRVYWQLNNWAEKTVYVFGLVMGIFTVIAFVAAFLEEI